MQLCGAVELVEAVRSQVLHPTPVISSETAVSVLAARLADPSSCMALFRPLKSLPSQDNGLVVVTGGACHHRWAKPRGLGRYCAALCLLGLSWNAVCKRRSYYSSRSSKPCWEIGSISESPDDTADGQGILLDARLGFSSMAVGVGPLRE